MKDRVIFHRNSSGLLSILLVLPVLSAACFLFVWNQMYMPGWVRLAMVFVPAGALFLLLEIGCLASFFLKLPRIVLSKDSLVVQSVTSLHRADWNSVDVFLLTHHGTMIEAELVGPDVNTSLSKAGRIKVDVAFYNETPETIIRNLNEFRMRAAGGCRGGCA